MKKNIRIQFELIIGMFKENGIDLGNYFQPRIKELLSMTLVTIVASLFFYIFVTAIKKSI